MSSDAKRPGVWGIDIGQCALKAIRLEQEDGQIRATAFDYIEHPKILNQPDADADELTREALEKFLSRNDLKGDLVAIGVPGLNGLARFVKLPPVDEKKIPDIVRFEAKQQIPFPLHEVVWGFQRLGKGTKSDNNLVMDAEVGLFAMKRDMINKSLQHFKDVGIEVHFIQMAPLAVCNFLAHDCLGKGASEQDGDEEREDDKECVVGLDIGSDNSSLVITDGERIIWQRPIPLGGNHFTRALTKDLKLTFAKAEHLKRNAIKSPDLRKILAALKPVLNDFVSEVQRSLGYFTNTHRDANIKYMVGLGNAFRLPGLQKFLQEKLQLEVRKLQKIARLDGEDTVTEAPQFTENLLSFGVAHGLALQGLNSTRIHTNLLPPEIAQERAIRKKKPWALAAAAVLLLLAPPLLIGYSATLGSWTSDEVKKAQKQLADASAASQKDVSDFNAHEKEAETYRKKMLELAGGVNERLHWAYLNSFISEAIPRPDGTHLLKDALNGSHPYDKYFVGEGQKANKRWPELRAKIADGSVLTYDQLTEIEEVKKHLVQVQIESVTALYSDKMAIEGAILFQGTPAPKEAGWLVEVRGYTFHEGREVFVTNTLIENLIDLSKPASQRHLDVKLHPKVDSILHAKGQDGVEKPLVSSVCMPLIVPVLNPNPGIFGLVSSCGSAKLLRVYGPPFGVPNPNAPTGDKAKIVYKPGEGIRMVMPDRKSWRPPSVTVIGESFGLQAIPTGIGPAGGGRILVGGPPPVPPGTPPGAVFTRTTRFEFVIVFCWQEPL